MKLSISISFLLLAAPAGASNLRVPASEERKLAIHPDYLLDPDFDPEDGTVTLSDHGSCPQMSVDAKCAYQHNDRLHREEGQTIESCQKLCAKNEKCGFYSFAEEGTYAGVCMGCTEGATDPHEGFNFYRVDCVGDQKIIPPTPDPKPDPTPPNPTPAIVTGDPHFVMWTGKRYDFHGGCDMVLIQDPDFNNGQGLSIHIRTKIQRWWSFVESAVVKIGTDTLEVVAGFEKKQYFVNGKPGEPLDQGGMMPFTIGGHSVRYRHLDDKSFQLKIFLDNDQFILLKSVKDFMRVHVEKPTVESFGNSVGLMGSFLGGEMLARDGVTVLEDPVEFGKEWQVLAEETMLFHKAEGVQHPETCAMPSVTADKRRLEGSISHEQAEIACARVSSDDMDDCISDVMATNDVDTAGAF